MISSYYHNNLCFPIGNKSLRGADTKSLTKDGLNFQTNLTSMLLILIISQELGNFFLCHSHSWSKDTISWEGIQFATISACQFSIASVRLSKIHHHKLSSTVIR